MQLELIENIYWTRQVRASNDISFTIDIKSRATLESCKLGMSICICQWEFPRGLPRSEFREQIFFLRGNENGGKNSPVGTSGRISGKNHSSCGFPESVHCLIFYFLFENSRYLFFYALWDNLVMSFVWLCIFCYTLWNILAMRFYMIIIVVKCFCIIFLLWMHYVLFFLVKREKVKSYYCHNFDWKI
jgi:hypothetical protein